jgi:hypothetical protein
VSATNKSKPGFAGCLISFEAPMTKCEAYAGALMRAGQSKRPIDVRSKL